MARPEWLKTQIFLDSGDPEETRKTIDLLGFLDGQTTNPTLVARNPEIQERLKNGEKFTKDELMDFYRKTVQKISALIPDGSVSIETYADHNTGADEILDQAKEMFTWIPNAHIKMPINKAGLEAAQKAVVLGIRVNMTLCFSQEQAVAVYVATLGARRGDVFVSPFIGRLDDIGFNGIDLTANIQKMFIQMGNGHVMNLSASIRDQITLLHEIRMGVDIATCSLKVLAKWSHGFLQPGLYFFRNIPQLKKIKFDLNFNFARDWRDLNISHPLTDKGIELFSRDWNELIKS